ncbi:hypothetical protein [Microbacterium halotolerans]|uniref:hypothetical protein n=1 Tax=Microbacterium halotolerans TaxID=246613 RepID=UPI0013C37061|nr:hypothetical protein [Microbacterium halotolerans]
MSGSGADGPGGNGWRPPEAIQPPALPPLPWEQEPDGVHGLPAPGAVQPPTAPAPGSRPPRLASTPLFQPPEAQSSGAPQGAGEPQRLPPRAAPQSQQPPYGHAYGAPDQGYASGAQGYPGPGAQGYGPLGGQAYAAPSSGQAPQAYASPVPDGANPAPQGYAAPSGAYGSTAAYGRQEGAAPGTLPYGGAPAAVHQGKRGFPAWAGWLIGVGVVVLIAAVLIVGYVISLLPSLSASGPADDRSAPVEGGGADDDQAQDDPDAGASEDASDTGGVPEGAIALDESVPTDLELGWLAVEPGGDWEVYYDSPESVVGFWDDGEHFCGVTAFSFSRYTSDGASDDATATQRDLADEIEAYAEDGKEAGSEQVSSLAVPFDGGAVEFLGVDVIVDVDADLRATERWYWRSFAEAETRMYVQLICDQEPTADMVEQSVGQLRMQ